MHGIQQKFICIHTVLCFGGCGCKRMYVCMYVLYFGSHACMYTLCAYTYIHTMHTYVCSILARAIHTYKSTYIHKLLQRFGKGYTYIHTYIHTNIHTYKHTYIHTCMHKLLQRFRYIHANIHTNKHTNIHTYIRLQRFDTGYT